MRKRLFIWILIIATIGIVVVLFNKDLRRVADIITQPTARELYDREFRKDDSIYKRWGSAFAKAYKDTLSPSKKVALLNTPIARVGTFTTKNLRPYIYDIPLAEGEILHIDVATTIDSSLVFIDVFTFKNDSILSPNVFKSNAPNAKKIEVSIKNTGKYRILVQPEIATTSSFKTLIYSQPQYSFPVSGKGNKSIQSFWGDPRSAGRRSHKGIDIFASRGTPVVATTDGIVSSTGNRGLGGKQVWLRDGLFGQSLYYAHLDSILAYKGQAVKVGDTLGFVGNTGNAKTTPPHLHFGIYRKTGAIDPLPFIKYQPIAAINDRLISTNGTILRNQATLRIAPNSKAATLSRLSRSDTITIVEKSENWYRIITSDTLEGYIYKTSVKLL